MKQIPKADVQRKPELVFPLNKLKRVQISAEEANKVIWNPPALIIITLPRILDLETFFNLQSLPIDHTEK